MGDLTNEYFARISFIKGVEWLSKFQPLNPGIDRELIKQKRITKKMKEKFRHIRMQIKIGE